MTQVLVGAVGFLIGIVAHDLGLQALDARTQLRPLAGTCPACRTNRGWNRLRCQCGRHVGREVVLALIAVGGALAFHRAVGLTWLLIPYLAFLGLSLALVVSDLEDFRIVDRLNLRGSLILTILMAMASILEATLGPFLRGLAGGAAYLAGSSLVFIAVKGRGFGAGDVKLAFQLGLFTAFFSWGALGWAVFATAMIGGAFALLLVLFGSAGMKSELPYGPPMVLGAWTAIALVGMGAIAIPT